MKRQQHFIKINEINNDTLNGLLSKAIFFAQNQSFAQTKPENIIASIFMEPSTRTEISFKLAIAKLGYSHLDFQVDRSSLLKGEDFLDTLDVLAAMGTKAVIIRTNDEELFDQIQNKTSLKLINAGSGISHHPTQALLDLVTIKQEVGRIDKLKIGIIGDLLHSRVANSTIDLHTKLGNELFLWAPNALNSNREGFNIKNVNCDDFLEELDVLIMLRVQFERHQDIKFTKEDYLAQYGLTPERLSRLKPEAIVLHPGPFNQGVEISKEVLKDSKVKILNQVRNAVPARMALLEYLLEGELH